jgi:hypothetical protein
MYRRYHGVPIETLFPAFLVGEYFQTYPSVSTGIRVRLAIRFGGEASRQGCFPALLSG